MTHHTNHLDLSRQQEQQQEPAPETRRAGGGKQDKAEALLAKRMLGVVGFEEIRLASDGQTAVIYYTNGAGKPCARAFRGRSEKPAFRYFFESVEQREKRAGEWMEWEETRIKERRAARSEAAKRHTLAVGDVLYSSWGWEQTNVDFYEVVAVRGCAVDIVKLKKDSTPTLSMQGTCTARKGEHAGAVIKGKRPDGTNCIKINSSEWLWVWDGRPMSWSSYA